MACGLYPSPSLLLFLLLTIVCRAHLSWVGPISRRQQAAQNWAISCSCHKCSTPSPRPSFSPSLHSCYNFLFDVLVCMCVRRGQFALLLFSCSWNWNYLLANWRTCWDWGKPRWPSAPLGGGANRQTDRECRWVFWSNQQIRIKFIHIHKSQFTISATSSWTSATQFVPCPCPCPALPRKQTKRIEFHMRQIFNLLSSRFISKEGERGRGGDEEGEAGKTLRE